MRWAGHAARMGERRGVYRVLVGKPEGKRPLGKPRLRWDLQNVECEAWTGSMCLSWRALVNAVMNLQVPYNVGNFSTS